MAYQKVEEFAQVACNHVRRHLLCGYSLPGAEDFRFPMLRHTYTSDRLSNGAAPKDVEKLPGHADVRTTMDIYAPARREAKRTSARLLDKVIDGKYIRFEYLIGGMP